MSETWDAVSAVATTLAVIVALGIPIGSWLHKKRAASTKANLVASRLIEPVKALEEGARDLMVYFTFQSDDPSASDLVYINRVAKLGSLASSINVDVLQALFVLPNGCAGRLAVALGVIDVFAREVEFLKSDSDWVLKFDLQRTYYVEQWRGQSSTAADYLGVVRRELQKAANKVASRPKPQEIYDESN